MGMMDKIKESKKNKAVFGIYKTRVESENAVEALKAAGFLTTDISVLLPKGMGSEEMAHTNETKSPEGAATGAGVGSVLGGTLGLLAGIGALAIPGVGPLIAAGPIMATLAGIGVGGVVGGVSGALIGLGLPEYEAKRYESSIREGGILLSVHVDTSDEIDRAKHVLETTGANDISTLSPEKGKGKKDVPPRDRNRDSTTDYINPTGL